MERHNAGIIALRRDFFASSASPGRITPVVQSFLRPLQSKLPVEEYTVSSRCYLSRALERLKAGEAESLFYAAFELRCGIEARLQEYLHPHEFIPLRQRNEWRARKLHRTTEKSFHIGDRVQRVRIYEDGALLFTLYYVPVTSRLKTIAERLGDYLHVAKKYHPPTHEYWTQLRELLTEGADLLTDAAAGTMLGPLLIESATGLAQMPLEMPPEEPHRSAQRLRDLKGKPLEVEVSYHQSLAEAKAQDTQ